MSTEPTIVERAAQPYVAITAKVRMAEIGTAVPPLSEEVFSWLGTHGVEPSGPAFWRYTVIDMSRYLQIEAGEPTAEPVDGDERVHSDVLPAGRYATLRHVGAPQTLIDATGRLLEWADGQGLRWDVQKLKPCWPNTFTNNYIHHIGIVIAGGRAVGLSAGDLPHQSAGPAGHEQMGDRARVAPGRLGGRTAVDDRRVRPPIPSLDQGAPVVRAAGP